MKLKGIKLDSGKYKLEILSYRIEVTSEDGRFRYLEDNNGFWQIFKYNDDGIEIYHETSSSVANKSDLLSEGKE